MVEVLVEGGEFHRERSDDEVNEESVRPEEVEIPESSVTPEMEMVNHISESC